MISISHSPNSTLSQSLTALSYIILPWKWRAWKKGIKVKQLEQNFADYHKVAGAISFVSGRSALYAALQAVGVRQDDEVIIQAYTCIVVPNAVMWCGAKPVYADIDETLNIDPAKIEEKITARTRALIVQHSFGIPADMQKIKEICAKHNLKLIEDCAHSLGAKYDSKLVGTFGDAAIFSFGRDKVISSIWGGMAIASDPDVLRRLREIQSEALQKSYPWIFQSLMHPILMPWMSALIGKMRIGQGLISLSQKIGLLNKVYTQKEKRGEQTTQKISSMPNALADLALKQLALLDFFNSHRSKIAAIYADFCRQKGLAFQDLPENAEPVYLRFTILADKAKELRQRAKNRGFIIGDWYYNVIVPPPPDYEKVYYEKGSCPTAEEMAQKSVNLPTHHKMSVKDAEELLKLL